MSVKSRKHQIEELEITVLEMVNNHPVKLSTVSPTSGKVYTISLTPLKSSHYGFGTICTDNAGNSCKGNDTHVCKHSLAAILHRVKSQGKMLYKCNSQADATRLNHILKGYVIQIRSERGVAWGVVADKVERDWKDEIPHLANREYAKGRLQRNVALMRDSEKYID
jgi:hypothetical protein